MEAVRDNNVKRDRSFRAGALAVGARVKITTGPGYFPIRNGQMLKAMFIPNAQSLVGVEGQ